MTRLLRRALAFVMALGTTAGCVTPRPPDVTAALSPTVGLTLLDTVVMATITRPPDGRREAWFGSLSGLARDAASGRYLAVIDDRQPSRVAWLDITASDGRLSVTPGDVLPTQPATNVDARLVVGADLEAIAALPDGTWVASEEGHESDGAPGQPPPGVWPPALLTLQRDLTVTRLQSWPAPFGLGPGSGGVRDNQGFESLTRTPDGRLIAGLERPLHADLAAPPRNGHPFSGGRAGPGRLVELVDVAGTWQPRRQWVYPIGRTAAPRGFESICDDGENGLTELLALDDTRLIALERACLQSPATPDVRNTVQLFLVDVSDATDVLGESRGSITQARPVAKALLLDFDALIPEFPPALANLDNFEALAFGPSLPDGSRTLLVMSDDNFRETQNTVFVWLRIEEAGDRR